MPAPRPPAPTRPALVPCCDPCANVEQSPNGMAIIQNGRFVAINGRAAALLGGPAEEIVGTLVADAIRDEDEETLDPFLDVIGAHGQALVSCIMRVVRGKGQGATLDVTGVPCEQGGEPAWVVTFSPTSGTATIPDDDRYALLANNATEMIALHRMDGTYRWVSPSVEALLGYQPESLVGTSPYSLVHPDDYTGLSEGVHRELLLGERSSVESVLRFRHKNGYYVWMESVIRTFWTESGDLVGIQSTSRDVTKRRALEAQLHSQGHYDPLTGLPNRQLFLERVATAIECAGGHGDGAVLVIDLDRFRTVNDTLGHDFGDRVLKVIARRLENLARAQDTVARLGSNEFAVLIHGLDHDRAVDVLASRIHHEVSQGISLAGRTVTLTASVGATAGRPDHTSAERVLREAMVAMHEVKRAGGGGTHIVSHTDELAETTRRRQLEMDLRGAVERDELWLAYQPIVRLSDGALVGFEALVRWEHPELGPLSPGTFVTVAEESGQETLIDEWVLREAARQTEVWAEAGYPLRVNVNCTGRDLMDRGYLATLATALGTPSLGKRLALEITESVLVDDPASVAAELEKLQHLGVRVCVDDFGTGYSSFRTLCDLPIDTLKADRSFVASMENDASSRELVRTVTALARTLGKHVVAEGIETPEQLALLREMGAGYGQGYLFSKPVSSEEAWSIITAGAPAWQSLWTSPQDPA